MSALILIAEDEANIAEILTAYFEREGFRTVRAADGRVALDLHLAMRPDLILLDINMPRLDGWEVLAEVRRRGDTPVMMITAMDKDIDRVQGLRIGADDYVVKPFSPVEVVARAKAILRRTHGGPQAPTLRLGPITIHLDAFQVTVEGPDGPADLKLTLTEFRLLTHLGRSPNRVFSRSELVDACMPESDAVDRTVDSHMSHLRRKLDKAGAEGLLISVRGVGYCLRSTR